MEFLFSIFSVIILNTFFLLLPVAGCPVVSNHKPPVRWEYNNRTLKEVSAPAHSPDPGQGQGLQHRMLVGGRVLEVSTLQGKFAGRYRCQTFINSTRQILSAWIYVHSEGECLRRRDAFPGREVFKMQVYYTVHVSYQRLSNVNEYHDMQ